MDATHGLFGAVRHRDSDAPFLGRMLTAAAAAAGDAVAVRISPGGRLAGGIDITYRELDERSSRLARELIAVSVGPGDIVAVGIPHSVESVLAMWAIAKTGGAYLPFDPTWPADRIARLLTDSTAKFGVTQAIYRAALGTGAYWVELDDPARADRIDARSAQPVADDDRIRPLNEHYLAYLSYTPGATGDLERMAVTHAGLAERRESLTVTGDVEELLHTFITGATLRISPPAQMRPPLVAGPLPARVPLSQVQHRIWMRNQADPESPADNLPIVLRLTGDLDVVALRHACEDVLTRHEALCTRYPASGPGGAPYQEVLPTAGALPERLEVERAHDIGVRVRALAHAGFDVAQRAPIRLCLLTGDAPHDYLLTLVTHRIAADSTSVALLAGDLMAAYRSRVAGAAPGWTPLPLRYADFAVWQQAMIGTDTDRNSIAAAQLAYWRERLAAPPARPARRQHNTTR
ncbi:AMP-binding protein, partial [Nocardia sp. NPDC004582]